jgi:hypothetical protein
VRIFPNFRIVIYCWIATCGIAGRAALPTDEAVVEGGTGAVGMPVRFKVYSERKWEGLRFEPREGVVEELKFYSSSRSPVHIYTGDGPIVFYRMAEEAEGERRVAAVVERNNLPEEALFIFVERKSSGAANAGGFDVIVFEDGKKQLPARHVVIANLAGFPLQGRLGNEKFLLSPGDFSPPFRLNRSRALALATVSGVPVFDYPGARMEADERALLILFPPYLPGSPEVQARWLRER